MGGEGKADTHESPYTKIDFICIKKLNTEKETMNVPGKNSVPIFKFYSGKGIKHDVATTKS